MIFALACVLHLAILGADIWTTLEFIKRGGSENKSTLSYKFMQWFGAYWWVAKVGLSVLLFALAGVIYALDFLGVASFIVFFPAMVLGTLGVYQNHQVVRDRLGGW